MYSTTAYLYQQITRVLLVDTSGSYFNVRYDPVYSKTLIINKGVDNVLLFEFINQDQRPVNIAGSGFVFRLMTQNGDRLLLEKTMSVLNSATGRVKVVLDSEDTQQITAQPGSYSIQRTAGDYVQAAFVDDNAQARGVCDIQDSVFPDFVPSLELTIPTIYGKAQQLQPGPTNWPDWAQQPAPINTLQLTEFFSSEIPMQGQSLLTVKMDMDHYTGTVKFQAADDYLSTWYDVTPSYEFLSETSTQYFNVQGFYPLVRAAFNNSVGFGGAATAYTTDGVLTSIQINNAGQDYKAAPRVQILGNGSGARAQATVSQNGVISSITVTAGGSGYLPVQFQSPQTATVLIDNGIITNLQYR